jgi:deaminated glutathione amidase
MRVAVGQFSAGLNKAANLEHIAALTANAANRGARLLVLPEGAMCDFGRASEDLRPFAEALDGPFIDGLRHLASRHGVTLVLGMFETIPGSLRIHNTAVVVDPRLGRVGAYRKRRLFDALGDRESERFQPGLDESPIVEVDGFKVGLAICYELRFPGLFESIADRGADLVLLPAAWVAGPLKEEQWGVLVRARAMDNTVYLVAAGQIGGRYAGRSAIIDPFGAVLTGLGETEGLAVADVTHERLLEVRARLPLLAQRRAAQAAQAALR